MLTFNLKKEWYEKIRSGEKRIEYRELKPYWTKRINRHFCVKDYKRMQYVAPFPEQGSISLLHDFTIGGEVTPAFRTECVLRLGYTKQQMTAEITKIEIVKGKDTDLHVDKPMYAIHIANVEEVEK